MPQILYRLEDDPEPHLLKLRRINPTSLLPRCRCSSSSSVRGCALGIMLFNLGMTADAAAAHNNELASSHSDTQLSIPSRHASPSPFSFGSLPPWRSSSRAGREKSAEPERPRYEQRRSMPVTAIEPISSSDDDRYSTAGPSPVRSQFAHLKSSKPTLRPKTTYQLAHPATNARHKRLKLRPKLLLQLQRVSFTSRPVPVFDVLPSTLFMPRFARKVPNILRGKRGLGPNDLIVTTSDLYERAAGDGEKSLSSDEENGEHRDVVGTICQLLKEDALAKGKAEICLESGAVWEATPLPNGSYEFAANTNSGLMILRWVRRGPKKRRLSAPPGSILPEDTTRRFTFSIIDPTTRRHPVIASMTRNNLEVYDRYSLPSTAPSSPTSAMSVISDNSEFDDPLDQQVIETDEALRMLIIVTGIWVAFREGWSHNFRYNDAATSPKAVRSPSVSKPTSTGEDDRAISGRDSDQDKQAPTDSNRRVVTWTRTSHQSPTTDRSVQYNSLSKRSNSTGAAFIERTNRRNSSSTRHNALCSPRQSYDGSAEPTRRNGRSRFEQRKAEREETKLDLTPAQLKSTRCSKQDGQTPSNQSETPRPTKGKRRHRFSNLFDFLIRKGGHHHD